jgi:hypothetical protein
VKEWSPNFQPATDTIEKVAVWVRISGLPIEYYDKKILTFIGNRIGKTVKVDKNTLLQERGKYARLCVEVDLTKALLAMFTIKGRKYNIEYEGLHLLCLNCGRFGHYKEGCPDKLKVQDQARVEKEDLTGSESIGGGKVLVGGERDGPWVVVQKQKRMKKGKEKGNERGMDGGGNKPPARVNGEEKSSGSRFIALSDDIPSLEVFNSDNNGENNEERMEESNGKSVSKSPQIKEGNNVTQKAKETKNMQNRKVRSGVDAINGKPKVNNLRNTKNTMLATRERGNFKGKNGNLTRKPRDTVTDLLEKENMEDLIGTHFKKLYKVERRKLFSQVVYMGMHLRRHLVGPFQ